MRRKMEESLQRAAQQLPRADFEKIASAEVAPMQQLDAASRQSAGKTAPFRAAAGLVAACLVIMAAVGGWFWQFRSMDAVVDIDVNPGFEITLNRRGKVLDVKAATPEGEDVLEGRNYRGWSLDDAVETLLVGLSRREYLGGDDDAVLVSARGRSSEATSGLTTRISARVAMAMIGESRAPRIVSQPMASDEALREAAAQHGITEGRMLLVTKVLKNNPPYTEQELVKLPVNELLRLAMENGADDLQEHAYDGLAPPPEASSAAPPVSSGRGEPAFRRFARAARPLRR